MEDETEQPEPMTIEDFNELAEGLTKGIDLLLNAQAGGNINYVLCLNHTGLEQMGVLTNAPPPEALNMVKSVSNEMHSELFKTKVTKSKIVLPH